MRDILPKAAVAADASADSGAWIPRTALLAAGDVLSFLVFAGVGRQSHAEVSGIGALGQVAVTALPFALGWFLVSPLAGAFRRTLTMSPLAMLRRTELAWLFAWPVTLLLRWAFAADHRVPVSFAIVILLANAVFLGIWRSLFAFAEQKIR